MNTTSAVNFQPATLAPGTKTLCRRKADHGLMNTERLFALLSNQGTAMTETVLTLDEYTDEPTRLNAERHAPDDAAIPMCWADVTDNDACREVLGLDWPQ